MIYFDYAAAAPVSPEYMTVFNRVVQRNFVNPESAHLMGRLTRDAVAQAESDLICALFPQWRGGHAIFTASATDAINVIGAGCHTKQRSAFFSDMEHPAVEAFIRRSTLLPVNVPYFKQPQRLIDSIEQNNNSAMVFITHVQSETGYITDIDSICDDIRKKNPDTIIVADCVQSAGKIQLPVKPDLVVISGHKLGTAGGAALIVNPNSKLKLEWKFLRNENYFVGRPEPVPVIAMAEFVASRIARMKQNFQHVAKLNSYIREHLPFGVDATMPVQLASPYILHLRTIGKQGAIIARMLSNDGIMISASSACQSEAGGPSRALTAMGLRGEKAYEGIRISFAPESTLDECSALIHALEHAVNNY